MDDDARSRWCATQSVGKLYAVFRPSEDIRCPGSLTNRYGVRVKCGQLLPGRPNPVTKVIVRVRGVRSGPAESPGLQDRCKNCGSGYEVFPMLEATG